MNSLAGVVAQISRTCALIAIVMSALTGFVLTASAQSSLGGVQLLPGYSVKRQWAVDAAAWTIQGKDGFEIKFEAGPNEGSWADAKDKAQYEWCREQTAHGVKVRYALVKSGLRTGWEPEDMRGLPPGNILLVTFLLHGEKSTDTANFTAKVASLEELADALLMINTFDPSKVP